MTLGRLRIGAAIALAALTTFVLAGPRVEAKFAYRFKAVQGTAGGAPTLILHNPGHDLVGNLVFTTPMRRVVLPFSLATGATQRFDLPPGIQDFGASSTLETNEGVINLPPNDLMGGNARPRYVNVGDDAGAMSFLKSQKVDSVADMNPEDDFFGDGTTPKKTKQASIGAKSVLDGKPDEMPIRMASYDGTDCVILSHAAVRMSDEAVTALRQAVLDGRSLVFIGGPGAPWWQDARWKRLLPAEAELQPVQVDGGVLLKAAKGLTASILKLKAAPDATAITSNGVVVGVVRRFGHGQVAVSAFDPTVSPLETAEGRSVLLHKLIPTVDVRDPAGRPRRRGMRYGRPVSIGSADDPFQLDLPPAGDIVLILVIYCIVVAPVNLLLLRKLGKPEWAWGTVPLIAASAAGLLLMKSQSLYQSGAASAVRGQIEIADGEPDAIVTGTSDVFYPNSGAHPVALSHCLDVTMGSNSGMTLGAPDPLTVLDTGRDLESFVNTPNLAFRSFSFRQVVPSSSILKVDRVDAQHVRVTNLTTQKMSEVSANALGNVSLEAGAAVVLSLTEPATSTAQDKPTPKHPVNTSQDGMTFGVPTGQLDLESESPDADIIHATLATAPVGVVSGKAKVSNEGVHVVYVLPKRMEPEA